MFVRVGEELTELGQVTDRSVLQDLLLGRQRELLPRRRVEGVVRLVEPLIDVLVVVVGEVQEVRLLRAVVPEMQGIREVRE